MRPTVKIDTRNKYRSEFWFGERMICHGNDGLESVELKTVGKRVMVVLTLTGVNILVKDSECPEVSRGIYAEIEKRFGNKEELAKLNLVCEMIRMSPTACDGCKYRPERGFSDPNRSVASRSPVG